MTNAGDSAVRRLGINIPVETPNLKNRIELLGHEGPTILINILLKNYELREHWNLVRRDSKPLCPTHHYFKTGAY
jgi:hypothetical protein